jgi:hypothetical protein
MVLQITPTEQLFARTFIRNFHPGYGTQFDGRDWRIKHKKFCYPLLRAHLEQRYWLATKAGYRPMFYNLDIDAPAPGKIGAILDKLDSLGISESQRTAMTSPSYNTDGSVRVYMRLELNDEPPTFPAGYGALRRLFGHVCEVYPRRNRIDRLPCGKRQDLIADDGQVLSNLTWQEEFHYLQKLDPIPLDGGAFSYQHPLFPEPNDDSDHPRTWKPHAEAEQLIENGLQARGTRNEAQYIVLNYYWRNSFHPEEAARLVKQWIRKKNNGFSGEVKAQRWRVIDAEIDRQTKILWARPRLPEAPNNLHVGITKADLEFAARLYPGDAVRQRQLANLITYYRPRQHFEWVFISRRIWTEQIAGSRTYQPLIADLDGKGVLECNRHYSIGEYSRRYRLTIPRTSDEPLGYDGYYASAYPDALWLAYGDYRAILELTGIDRTTLWRWLKQG